MDVLGEVTEGEDESATGASRLDPVPMEEHNPERLTMPLAQDKLAKRQMNSFWKPRKDDRENNKRKLIVKRTSAKPNNFCRKKSIDLPSRCE
jgi:hypothetical protein